MWLIFAFEIYGKDFEIFYILSLDIPSYVSKDRGRCFWKKKKDKRLGVILKHMVEY